PTPTLRATSYTAGSAERTWPSVDAFVQEVALARILDGVHYRNSTEVGTAMGTKVGELAGQSFPKPVGWPGGAGRARARLRGRGRRAGQRHVVVLADALQHEEGRGRFARVRDEVRPPGPDGVGLSRREAHLFLRVAQEDAEPALQHVERVLHAGVVVPRHLLRGRDLQLRDADPRPLGMTRPALDLVEMAGILAGVDGLGPLAWRHCLTIAR